MKRTLILSGGTINRVKEHLALCAPAFGQVGTEIHDILKREGHDSDDVKTRMGGGSRDLESGADLIEYLRDYAPTYGILFMACAVCDFNGVVKSTEPRLSSSHGYTMDLTPADKVLSVVKKVHPYIFLVAFKTTVGATVEQQYEAGLKMMKTHGCNLVLANDLQTKRNIIIVPEENYYGYENRHTALQDLCRMVIQRSSLTYKSSKWVLSVNFMPSINSRRTFMTVLEACIAGGAFPVNPVGFTVGHFGFVKERYSDGGMTIASSQRKANHNDVWKNGMTLVHVNSKGEIVGSAGSTKPSVGATSQVMIYRKYPEADCIIHFHGSIKPGSRVPIAVQKPFQCGSEECALNTVENMEDFDGIKAVHLNKHGPNIAFSSEIAPQKVINFIKENWTFGEIE